VQLRHLPQETTRESHGGVRLLSSPDDACGHVDELASHPEFQHNRNYRGRDEATAEMMAELMAALNTTADAA